MGPDGAVVLHQTRLPFVIPDQVRDDECINDRKWTPNQPKPFASSEVEMPLGLDAISMGVSTSLDTNGERG